MFYVEFCYLVLSTVYIHDSSIHKKQRQMRRQLQLILTKVGVHTHMWSPHLKKWGVNWPPGPGGSAAPGQVTLTTPLTGREGVMNEQSGKSEEKGINESEMEKLVPEWCWRKDKGSWFQRHGET